MDYQKTTEWMFQQLPMYQQKGAIAYKNDLTNILLFSAHLNHPEKKLKTIHVAGTNGKGSTSSMIASILQESGFKVGLYTSPHLKDFKERISINGIPVEEGYIVKFIAENRFFLENNKLSFFEMTVGMAFAYFEYKKVDFAVIEVGLGGRLDATNIINPLVSVITSIGLDHVEFLGNSLDKIAFEKAGIIKQNIPVVIGETTPETLPVFEKIAVEKNAPLTLSEKENFHEYQTDLLGEYQKQNSKTARATIEVLKNVYNLKINEKDVVNGFLNTVKNTGLKGRWQILSENPLTITDCAHNKHGLEIVLKQLNKLNKSNYHFVLGFVREKDVESILPMFPKNAFYYFTKPTGQRAMDEKYLQIKANTFGLEGKTYNTVIEAFEQAKLNANNDDCIYVGGSTFVVAEII
uniref:bifunctional folylpolyglutamate synthase/dihydrofolate synthase n=1 Tax=Flavobacterium sp. TaxID=239 RepID=UPI0040495730